MKEFRTISGNKAKFQINTISKSKLKAKVPKMIPGLIVPITNMTKHKFINTTLVKASH